MFGGNDESGVIKRCINRLITQKIAQNKSNSAESPNLVILEDRIATNCRL